MIFFARPVNERNPKFNNSRHESIKDDDRKTRRRPSFSREPVPARRSWFRSRCLNLEFLNLGFLILEKIGFNPIPYQESVDAERDAGGSCR